MADVPTWIMAGGCIATVIATTMMTTWRVSSMLGKRDSKFQQSLSVHELTDTQEFARMRDFVRQEASAIRSEFGTTVTTLRDFVNKQLNELSRESGKMELKMRESLDDYVRKADFSAAIKELKEDMLRAVVEAKDQNREDLTQLREDIREQFDQVRETLKHG